MKLAILLSDRMLSSKPVHSAAFLKVRRYPDDAYLARSLPMLGVAVIPPAVCTRVYAKKWVMCDDDTSSSTKELECVTAILQHLDGMTLPYSRIIYIHLFYRAYLRLIYYLQAYSR